MTEQDQTDTGFEFVKKYWFWLIVVGAVLVVVYTVFYRPAPSTLEVIMIALILAGIAYMLFRQYAQTPRPKSYRYYAKLIKSEERYPTDGIAVGRDLRHLPGHEAVWFMSAERRSYVALAIEFVDLADESNREHFNKGDYGKCATVTYLVFDWADPRYSKWSRSLNMLMFMNDFTAQLVDLGALPTAYKRVAIDEPFVDKKTTTVFEPVEE